MSKSSNNMSEYGADLSKRCLIMSKSSVIISKCGVDLSTRYLKLIMSNSSLIISKFGVDLSKLCLYMYKKVLLCPYVMMTCLNIVLLY